MNKKTYKALDPQYAQTDISYLFAPSQTVIFDFASFVIIVQAKKNVVRSYFDTWILSGMRELFQNL